MIWPSNHAPGAEAYMAKQITDVIHVGQWSVKDANLLGHAITKDMGKIQKNVNHILEGMEDLLTIKF